MSGPDDIDWPAFLRAERNKRGISQRALAKALGVSFGLISQYESGVTKPPLTRLIDICGIFEIEADSLFADGGPFAGHLAQTAEEVALLSAWRKRPAEWRAMMLGAIAGDRPPVEAKAKPAKAR
ncbi:MAG: helix-turn-helix transcriptional regulator [Proteobacteria bacterium]|nr:helix-turn-helix transcriptional regulator [Pseudomonadota bacterium]